MKNFFISFLLVAGNMSQIGHAENVDTVLTKSAQGTLTPNGKQFSDGMTFTPDQLTRVFVEDISDNVRGESVGLVKFTYHNSIEEKKRYVDADGLPSPYTANNLVLESHGEGPSKPQSAKNKAEALRKQIQYLIEMDVVGKVTFSSDGKWMWISTDNEATRLYREEKEKAHLKRTVEVQKMQLERLEQDRTERMERENQKFLDELNSINLLPAHR